MNTLKSLVMVIGETAAVRQREHMNRVWKLGESVFSDVDEQYLAILGSVYNSTVHRTTSAYVLQVGLLYSEASRSTILDVHVKINNNLP